MNAHISTRQLTNAEADGHQGFAIMLTVIFLAVIAFVIRAVTRRPPEGNRNPAERDWNLDRDASRFTNPNEPLP